MLVFCWTRWRTSVWSDSQQRKCFLFYLDLRHEDLNVTLYAESHTWDFSWTVKSKILQIRTQKGSWIQDSTRFFKFRAQGFLNPTVFLLYLCHNWCQILSLLKMCILTFYIAVKFLCIRILVFLKQFNKHVWIEIVEKLNGNDISVYRLSFEIKKKKGWFICAGVYDLCRQLLVCRQGDGTQLHLELGFRVRITWIYCKSIPVFFREESGCRPLRWLTVLAPLR